MTVVIQSLFFFGFLGLTVTAAFALAERIRPLDDLDDQEDAA